MRFVGAVVMLALLAACGDGEPRSRDTEYVAQALVLESPEHGPQLCFAAADPLPPQCGGPDIPNWSWKKVSGEERSGGTTWGDYTVHGTYAEGAFTLTRTPTKPDEADRPSPDDEPDFTTLCKEPAGGWLPNDRERLDEDESATALDRAAQVAETLPGYAELWIDSSRAKRPELGLAHDFILNVRVTKDTESATTTMRAAWPGALCVSLAEHTAKELERIQDEAHQRAGTLALSASTSQGRVDIDVFIDEDGALQKELDEEFGTGTVRVNSALRPVPPGV